ncbi:MAG: DUF4198 domain-containing protein [Acidobacteriia bacterium]|nr:DUF4198 domain-containing protein [Terriglobia bacterium]
MKNYAKSVATPASRRPLAALVGLLFLTLATVAGAQTLTGTVTNGTTKKPAAGDEIILINLSNGMDVAANTKADSAGKFSFTLKDGPGPHLIRAVHQGVTYHQMAPPGTNSVEVNVYDVLKKVPEIQVTADVMRFQADSGTLQGVRLFAVNNASTPPKTQMNDHNFEFYLPEGAKIDQAQAKAPNGQPISAETAPQSEKNRYAVVFPLRPGETQIQVQFTMPYSGSLKFDPKPLYPAEHAVVVIPKTMQFEAANASLFQTMNDPSQGDTTVEVAQQTQPGQSLAYTIKGTGTINESPQQTAAGAAQGQGQGMSNRPGGGLGTPIDTPDPLQQYRWWILGGFAIVLAAGGWYVTKRQTSAATASASATAPAIQSASQPRAAQRAAAAAAPASAAPQTANAPAGKSSMLLEALKEEMFQLELERRTGKITPSEYEKTKAALDQTLDRALKRQG